MTPETTILTNSLPDPDAPTGRIRVTGSVLTVSRPQVVPNDLLTDLLTYLIV